LVSVLASILHGLNYLHKSAVIVGTWLLLDFLLLSGTVPQIFSPAIGRSAGMLVGMWALCEWYRQRVYLDWQAERGCHWRAALLTLAKWPYILLALGDVIWRQRFAYIMTRKTAATAKQRMLVWPYSLVIVLTVLAWGIGLLRGHAMHLTIHGSALGIIAASLGLLLSEYWPFPPPYQAHLARTWRKRS